MLKSSHKQLHDITWPKLKEDLHNDFYALDFVFNARDKLAKIRTKAILLGIWLPFMTLATNVQILARLILCGSTFTASNLR